MNKNKWMGRGIIVCLLLGISAFVLWSENREENNQQSIINNSGKTITDRFGLPTGFTRKSVDKMSFAYYLRLLPLKPAGSKVEYYDGRIKSNDVQEAVVDMEIGKKDLQQCADAIMRLRAEYLYGQKRYDEITFNFTNGFKADYSKWRAGQRISVKGNNVSWYQGAKASDDYTSFRKYMDMVFTYAGTLSLSKSLPSKKLENMAIGDIFIQGGSPGHAVIVVDMAENGSGEKIFMLAQSYMPAQDIHVLKNLNEKGISPWYRLKPGQQVLTPEWTFESNNLKEFK